MATRLRALADRRRAEYDPRGFRAVGGFYCGDCRRARGNERGGCRARPNGRRAAAGGRLLLRLVRHAAARRRMAPLGTGRIRAATGNRVDVLPVPRPVLVRRPGAPADAHARDRSDRHRHGGRVVVGTGVGRGHPSPTRRGRRAQRGTAGGAARRAVGRPHAERRRRRAARATRARDPRRLRLRLDVASRRRVADGARAARTRDAGLRAHLARGQGAQGRLPGAVHLRRPDQRRSVVQADVQLRATAGARLRAVGRARVRLVPCDGGVAHPAAERRTLVRPHVERGGPRHARRRDDHELQRVARGDADRACARDRRPVRDVRGRLGPLGSAGRARVPRADGVLGRAPARRRSEPSRSQ